MDIFDTRTIVDFQKFTFSGHLRTHVYKVLNENIKLGHADYSCYWTLELLSSGLIHSYWNTIFLSTALKYSLDERFTISSDSSSLRTSLISVPQYS